MSISTTLPPSRRAGAVAQLRVLRTSSAADDMRLRVRAVRTLAVLPAVRPAADWASGICGAGARLRPPFRRPRFPATRRPPVRALPARRPPRRRCRRGATPPPFLGAGPALPRSAAPCAPCRRPPLPAPGAVPPSPPRPVAVARGVPPLRRAASRPPSPCPVPSPRPAARPAAATAVPPLPRAACRSAGIPAVPPLCQPAGWPLQRCRRRRRCRTADRRGRPVPLRPPHKVAAPPAPPVPPVPNRPFALPPTPPRRPRTADGKELLS